MARLQNLDIDLLRAFTTVAEVGGFTRAADVLLRRQSTLSLQIKRLEEALGRRLLDRTSRRVRGRSEHGLRAKLEVGKDGAQVAWAGGRRPLG